eukprot:Phypoly_transcript_07192.p1 GENE.Phypoly_transcript_07192~~Phypoly_transcript_07192.p1  ORF type:complete len:445 (+),score=69.15 Phypoly_transcript_07192:203-1537(+)
MFGNNFYMYILKFLLSYISQVVCVGRADNMCYPDFDPWGPFNYIHDANVAKYTACLGPRPSRRITKAGEELAYLAEVLEGECVSVSTFTELDADISKELERKRASPVKSDQVGLKGQKTISKEKTSVVRPTPQKFDHLLMTPWFKSYYQFGMACPRDMVITLGNTVLEAPTGSRVRYFESAFFRDLVYPLWKTDRRIHWKSAPQPTCADSMYVPGYWSKTYDEIKKEYAPSGYNTCLKEEEVAFDAADMMKCGKDIFYKKGTSANNLGIEWLRREFTDLRFHALHFPLDPSPHLDVNLIPLRPPTDGSEGIVLVNRRSPPLKSEMKLWEANNWKPVFAPIALTHDVSAVAICSSNLNMNMMSISEKCVVIEECETNMDEFLTDLGFDVIGVPLRSLNEFGGGVHCVTWDIKRRDTCKDYFPCQDYETERDVDLNNYFDAEIYPQ